MEMLEKKVWVLHAQVTRITNYVEEILRKNKVPTLLLYKHSLSVSFSFRCSSESDDENDGLRKQLATSPATPEPPNKSSEPSPCPKLTRTEMKVPPGLGNGPAAVTIRTEAQSTSEWPPLTCSPYRV
ncbi:hypothetical protein MRX96_006275 [Rhipicephalus microplus]